MNPQRNASDDEETSEDDDLALDETGVLARRLEQLRDERWMKPVLTQALARLAPAGPAVAGYDIEYCKIKPNRDINLVAHVRLGREGRESGSRRLSCTVFPSPQAGQEKYDEDRQSPLLESTRRRLAAEGFVEPMTLLDDPAMIVRVFPMDPLLPGLAPATDVQEMLPLFQRHLRPCAGSGPRGFRCEVLHYKPRRSCALHYTVDLDGGTTQRVYGKVARDDRGWRNYQVLEAAWKASLESGAGWRAARPLAYLPEWRLLLQEAVPGRDFRVVFGELTCDQASPAQLALVRRHLEGITRAVRSLQSAPFGPGPIKSFERLYAEQEKNLLYLGRTEPRLAADIAAIRRELVALERATRPGPLVSCHGDFAHGNVLIDGEQVGIIDFDKAGAAEPAFDVAYFLTHLWSFGIRHERRMAHVTALWKHMREYYLSLAPEVSSERLALYEALDFASYVLRNFRKQSHQASWLAWASGQIDAARDRLDVAAGKKGAVS